MRLRLISATDIARALPMSDCIETMKLAFADFSSGRAQVPQRIVMPVATDGAGGTVLVKPAHLPGRALGAKLVSVFPDNSRRGKPVTPGLLIHLDLATGEPNAILDGTFLTAWRTGAAGGAATDLLARADAKIGALLGAGDQARTQALAMDAVRELDEIRIYSRTATRSVALVQQLQSQTRCLLRTVPSASAAISGADIVTAATTSSRPVFHGDELSDGTHVNGVGSFTPAMQEIDITTVGRARVFVDSIASAPVESGDLVEAIAAGVTSPEGWVELGRVVEGLASGRVDPTEITFFKSVGLAVQDVAAGAEILSRAEAEGLGKSVEF